MSPCLIGKGYRISTFPGPIISCRLLLQRPKKSRGKTDPCSIVLKPVNQNRLIWLVMPDNATIIKGIPQANSPPAIHHLNKNRAGHDRRHEQESPPPERGDTTMTESSRAKPFPEHSLS